MGKIAVIFGGGFISHINPLKPLIKHLNEENYKVYLFNIEKYKEIVEGLGCFFIKYPNKIDETKYQEIEIKYLKELEQEQLKGNVIEYYKLITKIGAIRSHTFNHRIFYKLFSDVKKLNPTIIFYDAINMYGDLIAKELGIECIGYITNNIYNYSFLNTDNGYLWKTFSRHWGTSYFFDKDFFSKYWEYLCKTYKEVSVENNLEYLEPMRHFEPRSKKIIIFSSKYIQPKRALCNEKSYFFIPSIVNNFEITDTELKKFCKGMNKIVYIAHGSYLDVNLNHYLPLIKILTERGIKIVISTGKYHASFIEKLPKKVKLSNLIFCAPIINQKDALFMCDLFITHGGMNSIMEAISFETPMLLNPITPEQRMNALIVNNKKIGISNYKLPRELTTGQAILKLLEREKYVNNLHKLKLKILKEVENLDKEKLNEFLRK